MSVTDTAFAGHIGSGVTELAAVALANLYQYASAYLGIGFLSAMDTLIPQAWGAKNYRIVGIVTLRGIIWSFFLCIPIGWFWSQAEPIFTALHQDAELSRLAGVYLRGLQPGLPALFLYQVVVKYLNNMGQVLPPALTGLASLVVNGVLNWVFIWGIPGTSFQGWGFVGAAWSTSVARWFLVLVNILVIVKWKLHEGTWVGWQFGEALKLTGMWQFAKLGVPAGLALSAEVWGWEGTTLVASYLGAISLDAHVALLNTGVCTFILPYAFSQAVSQRVGTSLGSRDPVGARVAAATALFVSAVVQAVASIAMLVFRAQIARLFSPDPDVQAMIRKVMPLCSAFQVFDATQTVAQGVLRGVGRQHLGLVANLVGYYVVSIPIGILVAYKLDQGLPGIWMGLLAGLSVIATLLVYYTAFRIDWKKEVERASERLKNSGGGNGDSRDGGSHVTDDWSVEMDDSELQLLSASSVKNSSFSIADDDDDEDIDEVQWVNDEL